MDKNIDQLRNEMLAELTGNILPFWMEQARDEEHGGFIGQIDFYGRRMEDAPKGSVLNARILWTFSAAARVLDDPQYLPFAERAYHYITDHFIDKEFGGVFWKLDFMGNPHETRKQIYALGFTIYGLTEFYRATGRQEALDHAIALYRTIEKYSFDPVHNGYFEAFSREWEPIEDLRLSAKDENENKTMNTHLHILESYTNLYRVWKDNGLKRALRNVLQLFLERFVGDDFHLNLFYDEQWNLKSDLVSFGHDIECAWLLYEAAEVLGDRELLEAVAPVSRGMALNNFQGLEEDGGLIYEFFPSENRRDTDKHWWPMAEAVTGYFHTFQVSGDRHFLDAALRSWAFIQKYIIDRSNGEWYWSVNQHGIPYENEDKAGFWKCPYHNSRACLEVIQRVKAMRSGSA